MERKDNRGCLADACLGLLAMILAGQVLAMIAELLK